jgi:uncharacterized membrane protein YbhN (UPF0104 family)
LPRVLELIENVLAQLESADWAAVAVATAVHVANVAVRSHAWRNILAASYPVHRVGRRRIFSAYAVGAGVNAISPWRGGEVLRLSLAHRAVAGSTYAGLVSTVAVETAFNSLVAGSLVVWVFASGAVPMPHLNAVASGAALAVAVLAAVLLTRSAGLGRRFGAGFYILREPRAYLSRVAAWQALDWVLRLATIFWLMRAFGIDGGIEAVLLLQGAQSVSALIPFAPARVGTKQAVLVYALGSQVPTASLLAFTAGSEIVLTSVNAALGIGAFVGLAGTVSRRELLGFPRFAASLRWLQPGGGAALDNVPRPLEVVKT